MTRRHAILAALVVLAIACALIYRATAPSEAPAPDADLDRAPKNGQPALTPSTATPDDVAHTSRKLAALGTGASRSARDGCKPRARSQCMGGDVIWLDGCGNPHEVKEECGERLCKRGACAPVDPDGCQGVSPQGVCAGDTVRVCHGERVVEVDCAARGQRCAMGDEGAECRQKAKNPCSWPLGETRCEGDRIQACVAGEVVTADCALVGGACGLVPGEGMFGCTEVEMLDAPAPLDDEECGPCGCEDDPPGRATDEVCDGIDNDGDGLVDNGADGLEGGVCEAVDIVAFAIADRRGTTSHSLEDIEREIARINIAMNLGGADLGIVFQLADAVVVEAPELLVLDSRELQQVAKAAEFHPPRDNFYIPIIFADTVLSGGVPKAGVSTLPNGRCGGLRKGNAPQVPVGIVALSKSRSSTTGAHEVGHFLGLCHTHETSFDTLHRGVAWPEGEGAVAVQCDEACRVEGDGICDTPYDPGPEGCEYNQLCEVSCMDESQPDVANLMSYYTFCRGGLSVQQTMEVRRNTALRRAWHPCLTGDGCVCEPGGDPVCPEEMTCRPGQVDGVVGWRCGLDGSRVPGQPCSGLGMCGQGSFCLVANGRQGRCARPCELDGPGCTCIDVESLGTGVCQEDLNL